MIVLLWRMGITRDRSPDALEVASRENLRWVFITQGGTLRLYPAEIGVGVGRRSRSATCLEIHTHLVGGDDAAYPHDRVRAVAGLDGTWSYDVSAYDELLRTSAPAVLAPLGVTVARLAASPTGYFSGKVTAQ